MKRGEIALFKTFNNDRKWIENKYHIVGEPFNPYQRMAYHGHDYDVSTGLSDEEILAGLDELEKSTRELEHPISKAKAVEYVLNNTRIDADEHDYFVGLYSWNRLLRKSTVTKWKNEVFNEKIPEVGKRMDDLNASGAVAIWPDFDHVVPDWDSLVELGFTGLRERARNYRREHEQKGALTEKQKAFFDGIEIEYTAIIEFVDRLYRYALTKKHDKAERVAACLKQLRDGAPTNTYEAMQLIFLYFMISESVDHYQVRALGSGLDSTLYPFYVNDIKNGTFTRDEIREFLAYFMMQWSAIGNYWGQPFYLGGVDEKGNTLINELSHDIIDVYDEIEIYNPKIQIKYNDALPEDFLKKVLDIIRRGRYLVFCCEKGYTKAMLSYGATAEEARKMDIRGCYEIGVRANEVCTITGYVNPLKAVSYVFSDGYDATIDKQIGIKTGKLEEIKSFEEFYEAFLAQYGYLIDDVISLANAYDPYMEYINPSSMYSATIKTSLENAYDGYGGGVKYNNSSVLNCGLASGVDAVLAVKYLVFEKKAATLTELRAALDANWVGYEKLRAMALSCPYKYGNHNPVADKYASEISKFFCDHVHGKANGRGGIYKAELHSAMQFVWQGQKTGATPDGRRAGDEISKNGSPSVGMDKNGVTALIMTAVAIDPPTYAESICLDVMLHPSAVSGDDGLEVLKSLIDVYAENDGMAIQFNIFNSEKLRDAQEHPEQYKNLQVRVCGWNVLWNNLSRAEQDAYIHRAESIAQ